MTRPWNNPNLLSGLLQHDLQEVQLSYPFETLWNEVVGQSVAAVGAVISRGDPLHAAKSPEKLEAFRELWRRTTWNIIRRSTQIA